MMNIARKRRGAYSPAKVAADAKAPLRPIPVKKRLGLSVTIEPAKAGEQQRGGGRCGRRSARRKGRRPRRQRSTTRKPARKPAAAGSRHGSAAAPPSLSNRHHSRRRSGRACIAPRRASASADMLVFEYGFGTRQRRFRHRLPPCEPIGFAKAIVLLFAHRHNPPRPRRENCHRPAHAPAA